MCPSSAPVLPRPRTAAGRAGLQALLLDPAAALLALDFDGTLSPIVADPSRARPLPGALAALRALAPRLGGLAVVSGRPAPVVVEYAGLAGLPGLEGLVVLGHYGLQRWEARSGQLLAPPAHPGVSLVRTQLPELLAAPGAPAGTYLEDKGMALAVHTRRSPEPQQALEHLREPLRSLAERAGLHLEPGRFVLELRPRGMDKGIALRGLAEETGAATVAFAGDDLGDLPAFDAVDGLRAAGRAGLLVCSGSGEVPELERRADLVVAGPPGVVALLEALAAALDTSGSR